MPITCFQRPCRMLNVFWLFFCFFFSTVQKSVYINVQLRKPANWRKSSADLLKSWLNDYQNNYRLTLLISQLINQLIFAALPNPINWKCIFWYVWYLTLIKSQINIVFAIEMQKHLNIFLIIFIIIVYCNWDSGRRLTQI